MYTDKETMMQWYRVEPLSGDLDGAAMPRLIITSGSFVCPIENITLNFLLSFSSCKFQ